jgi:phthiocerol/phenolphthiocerol synthesis type-I polyketide synthase E
MSSEQSGSLTGLEIAIVGLALRFPGASTPEELWRNLRDGVESITSFSDQELIAGGVGEAVLRSPGYVKAGAILEDVESFDAELFGYSPREAQLVDPQQRLFLECCWEALEDAGYDPESFADAIGLYAGSGFNTYVFNLLSNPDLVESMGTLQALLGNDKDYLTTRAAYKLHLRGPAITVQTACSSSLVATHLACQGLLTGECQMAIAGGVSVKLPLRSGYFYREGEIYSPDGHCRAFDAEALGTVFGNGAGVVVLKRLADAMRDGDTIRAVIKGSAINNDGARKVGFTAPGLEGQASVIRAAQLTAEVEPATITYVEAHGTGTPLGDPIEVSALSRAFAGLVAGSCALGSVKTNLGHLDVAAGVAGLIKTVLALQHREIPPTLHFRTPNPQIDFAGSPFYVNAELRPWPAGGGPRRAAVSSFGIGGTNAHSILEEAPPRKPSKPARSTYLLALSAHTPTALEAATDLLAHHLATHPEVELADVAYTLQVGRRALGARRVVVCRTAEEAVAVLRDRLPGRVFTTTGAGGGRNVAFLFPGQGAQYPGMAAGLYATEPELRDTVDRCADLLATWGVGDIRRFFREGADELAEAEASPLLQPALFVLEYALARLWMRWGVRPSALIGHSLGEYVAACLAGVFSLEDALRIVAARARLVQRLPRGAMLSVALEPDALAPLLGPELAVAAVNAPGASVVAGPVGAVDTLARRLAEDGVEHRRLHTAYAFHSPMVDPILEELRAVVAGVDRQAPRIPYVSNVTGTWITPAEATDPGYWVRHLRRTVQFGPGIAALLADDDSTLLLEVGPGRTLTSLARRAPRGEQRMALTSLRHPEDAEDDQTFLLTTLGRLWASGCPVDWRAFHARERLHRVPLPTYPFERRRHWVERRELVAGAAARPAAEGGWIHLPSWRRSVPPESLPAAAEGARRCVLFGADSPLDRALESRLRALGHSCVTVRPDSRFERRSAESWTLDPTRREDFLRFLRDLERSGALPDLIVHTWTAAPPESGADPLALSPWKERGFDALLHLAQAFGDSGADGRLLLGVVATGSQMVTGEEALTPARALALGPSRVIPREYPSVACRYFDVPPVGEDRAAALAGKVLRDLLSTATDPLVAYRGGLRWVQTFEPVPEREPEPEIPVLRERGVYLITGGTGGIGLLTAEMLARRARARLVLVGRTPLPPREEWDRLAEAPDPVLRDKVRRLRAIEELGREVAVLTADAADPEAMRSVLARTLERFGALHGVIHAAGVPSGGLIQLKTAAAAEAVLAPKVRGALVLAELVRELPLDFLLFFSSTIAVTGDLGQVDYSAANSYLDALAQHLSTELSTQVAAIGWDRWQGVGMSVAANRAARSRQSGREVAHPLLQRCLAEGPDEKVFSALLSADGHWLLREHRMKGQAVLPGTAFLEMARAAFSDGAPGRAVEVRDLVFEAPLIVPEGAPREVRTVLERRGSHWDLAILSAPLGGTVGWTRHASGRLVDAGMPRRVRHPLGRPPEPSADLPIGALGQEGRVTWGPRWQSLRAVRVDPDETVALLELPDELRSDVDELGAHPALLDVATALGALGSPQGDYLPLAYGRVRIDGSLPSRILVSVRRREEGEGEATLVSDVRVSDPDGVTLIEIEGFTLKKMDRASAAPASSAAPARGERAAAEDAGGIPAERGIEILERLLGLHLGAHVIVSPQDFQALAREAGAAAARQPAAEDEGAPATSTTNQDRPQIQTPYVEPRNELERMLAGIWRELLGIEQIGIHDNFFELGGHSLLAIRLGTKLRDELDLEVPISRLFRVATVAELAEMIIAALSEQASEDELREAIAAVEEESPSGPEGSLAASAPHGKASHG